MPTYLSPGVYIEEVPSAVKPIAGVGTSTAGFIGIIPDEIQIPEPNPKYDPTKTADEGPQPAREGGPGRRPAPPTGESKPFKKTKFNLETDGKTPAGQVRLITNFSEFQQYFGDFSMDSGQRNLAHAVHGFFNNGGTRCFVVREKTSASIESALKKFEAIDEIAIVAAPGIVDDAVRTALVTHCDTMDDRFAILDGPETVDEVSLEKLKAPGDARNAAFYFPWLRVFDTATKLQEPDRDGRQYIPPSGHIAGIYARTDTERGVHKAPANEPVRGALGLKYYISKAQQDGLNPTGINCIRDINGGIKVWGARTIGGDRNLEWKYVNVRRLMLFLKESIDEGTQWVVFEPNTQSLWGKIKRNVSAFLTNVWRDGALFGATPEQAFYVKCDEETNPPEVRELGQVVTEIGVAIARPAEFVVFRITQWTSPKQG